MAFSVGVLNFERIMGWSFVGYCIHGSNDCSIDRPFFLV